MRSFCIVLSISVAVLVMVSGPICAPAPTPPPDSGDTCTYTAFPSSVSTDTTLAVGCYDVPGLIDISAGLTLQPGTVLRFAASAGLQVGPTGYINAVGTAASGITFTGATATRGSWRGVRFIETNSANNRLEYVTIEYAGEADSGGLFVSGAGSPAAIAVSHCAVRQSLGYGFWAVGTADLSGFSTNTFTQNAQGAALVEPDLVRYLDTASTFQGNDVDAITLLDGEVTTTQIWPDLDARYVATNVQVYADLTLLPGVTVAFASEGVMNVHSTGSLRAFGTGDRPITLTGTTQTSGFWKGLSYTNSSSGSNNLTLVTIEYGGSDAACLTLNTAPVRVFATHCTFAHSGHYGVTVVAGGTINTDIETINTFTDVPDGTVLYEP